jgi:hypothetical protein
MTLMTEERSQAFAEAWIADSICIHYESVNGLKAVEWRRFNDAGQVTEAMAHYDQSPE